MAKKRFPGKKKVLPPGFKKRDPDAAEDAREKAAGGAKKSDSDYKQDKSGR